MIDVSDGLCPPHCKNQWLFQNMKCKWSVCVEQSDSKNIKNQQEWKAKGQKLYSTESAESGTF